MNDFIAYCGLDCEACEARIATVNGDEALREKVAKEWSALNGVLITPKEINCTGCRIDGAKTPYCDSLCPIRACAREKGVSTCGDCEQMSACDKLAPIQQNNADARQNLAVGMPTFETRRLILRPWTEDDAEALFEYAKDPRVGPRAGWPAHTNIEESRRVIREVLSAPETYAIVWKETGQVIGDVALKFHCDLAEKDDECELGYWLGVPFWGLGIMPEAAKVLIRHAFEDLRLNRVWCGYYDDNLQSRRVQEKCGFRYQWTTEQVEVPLMHEVRTGHVSRLTREEWLTAKEKNDVESNK